jgi:hypothetical protein
MSDTQVPTQITPAERLLTAAAFQHLAEVSPEFEWLVNLTNPSTKGAYEKAIGDFMRFAGIGLGRRNQSDGCARPARLR